MQHTRGSDQNRLKMLFIRFGESPKMDVRGFKASIGISSLIKKLYKFDIKTTFSQRFVPFVIKIGFQAPTSFLCRFRIQLNCLMSIIFKDSPKRQNSTLLDKNRFEGFRWILSEVKKLLANQQTASMTKIIKINKNRSPEVKYPLHSGCSLIKLILLITKWMFQQ